MACLPKADMNFRNEIGRGAVSVDKHDKIDKVRKLAGMAVCKIQLANGVGSGAFYNVLDNYGRDRFLVMTCNHVLPTTSINYISKVQFMFYDIPQMNSITLDKTQVKFVWTQILLDATVIEISPSIATLYKSYGAQFLQIGEVKSNVDVVILQYPNGKFSIADGDIESINGTQVFYKIGTEPGSSGSPLLDLNCVALAMHNSGLNVSTCTDPSAIRKATALKAVVSAYLKDKPNIELDSNILK